MGSSPLADVLTAANVDEIRVLERGLDALPPVRGKAGRLRRFRIRRALVSSCSGRAYALRAVLYATPWC